MENEFAKKGGVAFERINRLERSKDRNLRPRVNKLGIPAQITNKDLPPHSAKGACLYNSSDRCARSRGVRDLRGTVVKSRVSGPYKSVYQDRPQIPWRAHETLKAAGFDNSVLRAGRIISFKRYSKVFVVEEKNRGELKSLVQRQGRQAERSDESPRHIRGHQRKHLTTEQ